jgi:hypothetical protein
MGAYAGPEIVEDGLVLALDAGNKKSYSQNEHPNSLDIYGWYVGIRGNATANNCTISRDTISSPVGNTPLKMNVTGNDPHIVSYNSASWNIAPAANGQTWIVSVYVKADVATTGEILIFGANSSGAGYVNGAWLSLTATTVNIGTEWTRVQHVHTMNNADVAYIHIRLDGPNSGGTGQTVWWDGLQVERVPSGTTTPTPFTSAYYGGSVYKDLVGSNNGTLRNSPTYSGDNSGKLVFDGVNDDVDCGNNSSINFGTGDFTVSVWFRRFSNATTNLRLLSKAASSDSANAAAAGFCFFGNDTSITFAVNPTAARSFVTAATYSLNEWVNVVGLVERGVSMRGYKNGSLAASTTAPVGSVSGTTSLFLGSNAGSNVFWEGEISNVSLYNRALTASEIQQNYNATKSRFGL